MPPPIDFGPHIVPQRYFGFSATQSNLIVFGPQTLPQLPPPRCNYKAKLHHPQKALEDSFPGDIPFPDDILFYIPAQTLNKTRKDIIIDTYHYKPNTPYPERHLMHISEQMSLTWRTSSIPTTKISVQKRALLPLILTSHPHISQAITTTELLRIHHLDIPLLIPEHKSKLIQLPLSAHTLPPQESQQPYHLWFQQRSHSHLHHMTSQWRSLSTLHYMHQVSLPVDFNQVFQ